MTTALKTTYPPGSEVVVYSAATLLDAEAWAESTRSREHVGPHIYQRPERYRVCNLEAPEGLRYPDLHFEIDTREDYEVVCQLYEHFLPANPGFGLAQAIDYAIKSGICEKNRHVERRWREYRSDEK